MTRRRSSLTGSWSGAFRYPDDHLPETVFNAHIEDLEGSIRGWIQEPNLRGHESHALLTSDFFGTFAGKAVQFQKRYDGSGEQRHVVQYEGTVDDWLTRVEGAWIIRNVWSGTFFMNREDYGMNR